MIYVIMRKKFKEDEAKVSVTDLCESSRMASMLRSPRESGAPMGLMLKNPRESETSHLNPKL